MGPGRLDARPGKTSLCPPASTDLHSRPQAERGRQGATLDAPPVQRASASHGERSRWMGLCRPHPGRDAERDGAPGGLNRWGMGRRPPHIDRLTITRRKQCSRDVAYAPRKRFHAPYRQSCVTGRDAGDALPSPESLPDRGASWQPANHASPSP